MMLHYRCPGIDALKRLMLGHGEEAEFLLFEEHLLHCDSCFAALQRLKVDDPLVLAMETAASVGAELPADAVLRPLLDRLFRLPENIADQRGDDASDERVPSAGD